MVLFILSFSLTVFIVVLTIRTVFTKGVNADDLKRIEREQKEAMVSEMAKIKATSGGGLPPPDAEVSEKLGWFKQPVHRSKPDMDEFAKMSTAELRPPTRSNRPPTRSNEPNYTGWKMSKGRVSLDRASCLSFLSLTHPPLFSAPLLDCPQDHHLVPPSHHGDKERGS